MGKKGVNEYFKDMTTEMQKLSKMHNKDVFNTEGTAENEPEQEFEVQSFFHEAAKSKEYEDSFEEAIEAEVKGNSEDEGSEEENVLVNSSKGFDDGKLKIKKKCLEIVDQEQFSKLLNIYRNLSSAKDLQELKTLARKYAGDRGRDVKL